MIEVEDLLPEVEILQHTRAALAGPERVLVVGDHRALLGRQPRRALGRDLVGLAAVAALHPLVTVLYRLAVGLLVVGHEPSPGCVVPAGG